MKEFIISEALTEKAVLVGLITPEQNEQKVKEYLDELAFLADTAGAEAVKLRIRGDRSFLSGRSHSYCRGSR